MTPTSPRWRRVGLVWATRSYSGWASNHVLRQGTQHRLGIGIWQAVERVDRLLDILPALPSVVEGAALFQGRTQPPAGFGRSIGEQGAEGHGGGGLGQAQESNDRQCQFLFLEVGSEALAGDPFLAPYVQDIVGDLKGDTQASAVPVQGGDGRFGAPA